MNTMDKLDKFMMFGFVPFMALFLGFCGYMAVVSIAIQPQEQYKVYQRLQPETLVTYDEWFYLGDEQRAVLLSGNVGK
jgi:hypothetical protein